MNKFAEFFWNTDKRCKVHKWHHYFDIYDRHFSKFKGKNPVILEIGIYKGGSLEMWNHYFDGNCSIIGIDINPECKEIEKMFPNVKIFIGNQADDAFLAYVKSNISKIDIIIDDGSHISSDVIKTFELLYPIVSVGGVYLVEDLHTSYWEEFDGGLEKNGSSIEYFKKCIDKLNAKHIRQKDVNRDFSNITQSIHFYDSITVIEKHDVIQYYVDNSIR